MNNGRIGGRSVERGNDADMLRDTDTSEEAKEHSRKILDEAGEPHEPRS